MGHSTFRVRESTRYTIRTQEDRPVPGKPNVNYTSGPSDANVVQAKQLKGRWKRGQLAGLNWSVLALSSVVLAILALVAGKQIDEEEKQPSPQNIDR